MTGFFNIYQKDETKTEYLEAVENIWGFIKQYLIDDREGREWIQEVDMMNQPVTSLPLVGVWKCPYHNSRLCLEFIKRNKKKTSFELPKLDFF